MIIKVGASTVNGSVRIPPSKSHSIRAVFLASLAEGTSNIRYRLHSADVDSAITACRGLGAEITENGDTLTVKGVNGHVKPIQDTIDVGNSGTTANFVLSMASLSDRPVTITADDQTRKRPVLPLCRSLEQLGAIIEESDNGKLPIRIRGPIRGGTADVDGATSQYLSSLLIHAPFCESSTTLRLTGLNEKPYADMTVDWLKKLGIQLERKGYQEFNIQPKQKIKGFEASIVADFSSSAFFLILAAIPGCKVELQGLDFSDTQGDKEVVNYLKLMGADIEIGKTIKISGRQLRGHTIDLNNTPDALPAMAVAACLAQGTTRLTNVPQARIKETDRIEVMAKELKKMGADIAEEPDGLVIHGGKPLTGTKVDGHYDHRVVMSLAIAGLAASGETIISTAEAIKITFPDFVAFMKKCGAKMEME
jgi:3-phosphoshikimate 1-carboxyvinyltransferase